MKQKVIPTPGKTVEPDCKAKVSNNDYSKFVEMRNDTNQYTVESLRMSCYFIVANKTNACWLYNNTLKSLYPLVDADGKILFLSVSDIDKKALEVINKECPDNLLYAKYRFWILPYTDRGAEVEWTVCPDGSFYQDEDGFGMTDDFEITLHGLIGLTGKPNSKFKLYEHTY